MFLFPPEQYHALLVRLIDCLPNLTSEFRAELSDTTLSAGETTALLHFMAPAADIFTRLAFAMQIITPAAETPAASAETTTPPTETNQNATPQAEGHPLDLYDDNNNGRITCAEARRHNIAPVRRDHPAYPYMRDPDGDGVVCE